MLLLPIVIERRARSERAYNLYSRPLDDCISFLGSPVEDLVVAQLLHFESVASEQPGYARPSEAVRGACERGGACISS